MNPTDLLKQAAKATIPNEPNPCRYCKHAVKTNDEPTKETFACRRNPPQLVVAPAEGFDPKRGRVVVPQVQSRFPDVGADWTCGEFQRMSTVLQ